MKQETNMQDRVVGLVMLLAMLVGARAVMAESAVPPQVVGEWVAGSPSMSTYWDQNGAYVGPATGAGQLYKFSADGTFDYYMYMETRTYNVVSKVRTRYHGKVAFDGEQFTLHLDNGHYDSSTGSRIINRDMTAQEMAKASKSYNYRMETAANGKPKLVVPFDDGIKFEYEPIQNAAK